jgi:hypothetical protein
MNTMDEHHKGIPKSPFTITNPLHAAVAMKKKKLSLLEAACQTGVLPRIHTNVCPKS